MINIVFFGECMLEESDNENERFGGDSLNSALYCARVADKEKVQVSYATAIGKDKESITFREQWQLEDINTDFVRQIEDKQLGRYSIKNNERGERSFTYDRDDSAAKYYFDYPRTDFEDALLNRAIDCFYFTGISLAILSDQHCEYLFNLLTEFKHKGGRILFDNNYREILWKKRNPLYFYQQAMKLADIAFLTDEDEYRLYGGNTIASIVARYPLSLVEQGTELVIKQGDKPCLIRAITDYSALIAVPGLILSKKAVVDTCAAGDAFSAGYLAKRVVGSSINTSAKFAHELAGRVIQHPGAIISRENMGDLLCSS